jgi:hypothetical protein
VTLAATLDAALPTAPLIELAWLHAVTTQTATIIHTARTHFAAVLRGGGRLFIGLIASTDSSGPFQPDLSDSLPRPDRPAIALER